MLTGIKVKNFKCFENASVELSKLNLFSGINSMGKSTLLQALLLLRQSEEQGALERGIYLNGAYTNIGNGRELLYRDASQERIEIDIMTEDVTLENHYIYKGEADFLAREGTLSEKIRDINLFGTGFSYIAADRLGPQSSYQKSYYEVWEHQQLGTHGEYAVHFLQLHGLEPVTNAAILYNGEQDKSILRQVERWMGEITPGISFRTEDYGHSNRIGLTVHQASTSGAEYFPVQNVGFGISYVLPVVLSLVKAKPGELVIIENPEAHLHPAGQRKIGELMARAAHGGVQIIVETHSDHVLNGIRLAVKRGQIVPDEARLYYFTRREAERNGEYISAPVIEMPVLKGDGRLSFWPDGFFDEWDKAIDELF